MVSSTLSKPSAASTAICRPFSAALVMTMASSRPCGQTRRTSRVTSRSLGATHEVGNNQKASQEEPRVRIHLRIQLILHPPPGRLETRQRLIGNLMRFGPEFVYRFLRTVYRSEERRVGKECRSRWSPE